MSQPVDRRTMRRRQLLLLAGVLLAALGAGIGLAVSLGDSTGPAHAASGKPGRTSPPVLTHPAPRPSSTTSTTRTRPAARPAELDRMLGQMVIARFPGSTPSPSLLERIRAGQVGGVILFGNNVSGGVSMTRALADELQHAAAQGGNPPLLIMTDQEGGEVRRLAGPPTLAPSEMGSSQVAFQQGVATGELLRSAGINVDLAPVADVEREPGSFLGTRSFGSSPSVVAERACAFARGLESARVAYTLKHFPGLGRASGNTDLEPVTISGAAADLRADYAAYRTCGAGPMALIMVSSAIYPTLAGPLPAVMSPAIYTRELPSAVSGGAPLTISDDLQAAALANQAAPARHAINAGLDLLLYAQTEPASAGAYAILLAEARDGLVSGARISQASRRIAALKRLLGR